MRTINSHKCEEEIFGLMEEEKGDY